MNTTTTPTTTMDIRTFFNTKTPQDTHKHEDEEWKVKEDGTWDCVCVCGEVMNAQCSGFCDPRKGHHCMCDECGEESVCGECNISTHGRKIRGLWNNTLCETCGEESDSESESDPEMATLVKALKELGTTTARKLAKHAGMEKHRVNQLLYGTPTTFCEDGKDGVAPLWTLVDESDEGNTCERCETKGDDVGDCDGHILCPDCVDHYNATFSYEGRTWCDDCDETHGEGDECYPKKRYVLPK